MLLKIETLEDQLQKEKTSFESKVENISVDLQNKADMVEMLQSAVKNLEDKIAEKESLLESLSQEKVKLKESMLSQGLNLGKLGERPACYP